METNTSKQIIGFRELLGNPPVFFTWSQVKIDTRLCLRTLVWCARDCNQSLAFQDFLLAEAFCCCPRMCNHLQHRYSKSFFVSLVVCRLCFHGQRGLLKPERERLTRARPGVASGLIRKFLDGAQSKLISSEHHANTAEEIQQEARYTGGLLTSEWKADRW